jgi:predicted ATPase
VLIPNTVAQVLGLREEAGKSILQTLLAHLKTRRTLLLFDNCEHVVAGCAALADELLRGAAGVRILATSREALRIPGEQTYPLPPLTLPERNAALDALLQSEAVRLFLDRVRLLQPDFAMTEAEAPTIVELCTRLDGIPLALELAAGRVRSMPVAEINRRLHDRFKLLTGGSRVAPERQQTLRAMFDWSYYSLPDDEQTVFRRLGVFADAFALDDAVTVIGDVNLDAWAVTDLVGNLVERSLLTAVAGAAARYTMSETGRVYAIERLLESGDVAALEQAAGWYVQAGDAAAAGSANLLAVRRYSSALELATLLPASRERDGHELDVCLKLGPAVQTTLGPSAARAEAIFRRAVDLARGLAPDGRRFKALWGYWQFLAMSGRDTEALAYCKEVLELAQSLGDEEFELEACHAMMSTQQLLGNVAQVVDNARRAIAIYDRHKHHHLTFSFGGHDPGVCTTGQGSVGLWLAGYPDQALKMAADALALGAKLEHAYSRAVAYYYTAMTFWACGRSAEFADVARRLRELSRDHEMEMLLVEAKLFLGRVRYEEGESAAGIAAMQAELTAIEAGGDFAFIFFYVALLADALIAEGRASEAETLLEHTLRHADRGQGFFLPEIHRLLGETFRLQGRTADASQQFRIAGEAAVQLGAASLVLRAAISQAAMHTDAGPAEPAAAALRQILATFGEGADTCDIAAARKLLARYPN